MKTLLLTSALLISATTASAFTCKNTVTRVDGKWIYTSSQCGTQAPASAEVLEMITYTANNPPKDYVEEVVTQEVVTEEVTVVEPTKLDKLNKRLDNMTARKGKLTDRIQSLSGGAKKKALKQKRRNLNKRINRVNARINKLSN